MCNWRKSALFFVFSKLLWKVSKNSIQLAMLIYINMALVGNIVISDFFVLIL